MMKKVLEYQQQMGLIEEGDRIVAGFSGGADSVCLLLVLEALKEQIDFSYYTVHVEHGIRGEESLADAAFAKRFCEERQIPIVTYHVNAPQKAADEKISLEEAARELRYECFEQARIAYDGTKVAVAHHADDNAETMLFHLARGTSLRGLAGILPKREGIIRPLLCVTREEIEDFLGKQAVEYCVDSTNEELVYSRNRIRKAVIPQLKEVNSRAVEHMASLSAQIEELYDFVSRMAWETGKPGLTVVSEKEIRLKKELLVSMEPVLQREFLHQVMGQLAGSKKDLGAVHVESLQQLLFMDTGKSIHLPYGLTACVDYAVIVLEKNSYRKKSISEKNGDSNQQIKENGFAPIPLCLDDVIGKKGSLVLESGEKVTAKILDFDGDCEKIPQKTYTKWFDYDKIKNTVLLRNRAVGDYLIINQQGNQKKLKEYFIHEKIAQRERDQILLLADGAHIIWVVGYRISEGYKVTPQTKRILEVQVEKEKEHGRNNS